MGFPFAVFPRILRRAREHEEVRRASTIWPGTSRRPPGPSLCFRHRQWRENHHVARQRRAWGVRQQIPQLITAQRCTSIPAQTSSTTARNPGHPSRITKSGRRRPRRIISPSTLFHAPDSPNPCSKALKAPSGRLSGSLGSQEPRGSPHTPPAVL